MNILTIVTSCVIILHVSSTSLQDFYKHFKKNKLKHESKQSRSVSSELSSEVNTEELFKLGVVYVGEKRKTKHKRKVENNSQNLSPESWLSKFYRKSIVPRKLRLQEPEIVSTTTTTTTETPGDDYEYVIFIDDEDKDETSVINDGPPQQTDFNTVNLYNELFKVNLEEVKRSEKLKKQAADDSKEDDKSKDTTINIDIKITTRKQNIVTTTPTTVKTSGAPSTTTTATTTSTTKSIASTKPRRARPSAELKQRKPSKFRDQLENFFDEKPFTMELDHKMPFRNNFHFSFPSHNPVADIHKKMREILHQSNQQSESRDSFARTFSRRGEMFDSFDDFRNTNNLIFDDDDGLGNTENVRNDIFSHFKQFSTK